MRGGLAVKMSAERITGRFAPSSTGPAHPGTLLAGLLAWLDARSRGGRVLLRIEDLDPERCRPEFARGLVDDLRWLGLEWDALELQSEQRARHEAALDRLAALGRLYPSPISRRELEALGRRAPDGGWAYDNRERGRPLPAAGWRACVEPLRVRLDDGELALADEGGADLSQDPALAFGDPLVRRRDGAIAYQLAVVVDDAAAGVTRVVRGRDIAPSTATQVALQRLLGLPQPVYRHHLLLLERRGHKLAKLHGAVGAAQLRAAYDPAGLCGWLAWSAGLQEAPLPCTPAALLADFAWARVRGADRLVRWTGARLEPGDD
jgi:glutamyl/glutaminyl-tRNA synthetase